MNKKKLIALVSLLIIIIGGVVLLFVAESNKVYTEEDYKENPHYMLEELVVSDGKHLKVPNVKEKWYPWYTPEKCEGGATLKLTKQGYKSVINQLDNELKIPRFEESEYKDRVLVEYSAELFEFHKLTDEQLMNGTYEYKALDPDGEEAKAKYIIKVADCKYQTKHKGEKMVQIIMYEKYSGYYMWFRTCCEGKMFSPYSY